MVNEKLRKKEQQTLQLAWKKKPSMIHDIPAWFENFPKSFMRDLKEASDYVKDSAQAVQESA